MSVEAIEREITLLQKEFPERAPRLGCSFVAHRHLGFCGGCVRPRIECLGWQLLALKTESELKTE